MKSIRTIALSFLSLGIGFFLGCTQPAADQPPTAVFAVTPSQAVSLNEQVTVDASGSGDPQGYAITYSWSLTPPAGSAAALSVTNQKTATFTADVEGNYDVTLAVTAKVLKGTLSKTVTAGKATVATPTFSPAAGTYTANQSVTISCATSGAAIHYTTNGDIPTALSPVYGAAVPVSGNGTSMTIKAMAVKTGMTDSAVASADYTISYPPVETPIFSPAAGTYPTNQSVTISSATSGSTIYYTTNGTVPTTSSLVFSGPSISVAGNGTVMTIQAFAAKTGMTDSAVASATYTIQYPTVATPTFTPAGGTFSTNQSVTISCATSAATIHYTTTGTNPTTSSPIYGGSAISVSGNGTVLTIKALAVKTGMTTSAIASATYTIDTGVIVFDRPAAASPTLYLSSWADPNGSDADEYVWDDFTPAADSMVTQVFWRGGYMHDKLYTGPVWHFTIAFFESIAGGSEPHVTNPQLPEIYLAFYDITGNANETPAGATSADGHVLYEYHYTLPTAFHVAAGTKYWIRIEASQIGVPDWCITQGTGGDGAHFMFDTGAAMFFAPGGDIAFTLK